jgi:hypothetical protein
MIACSCAFGRVSSFSSFSCLVLKKDITADLRRRIDHFLAGVAARFERSKDRSRSFRRKRDER